MDYYYVFFFLIKPWANMLNDNVNWFFCFQNFCFFLEQTKSLTKFILFLLIPVDELDELSFSYFQI